jgi:hypothetical protein
VSTQKDLITLIREWIASLMQAKPAPQEERESPQPVERISEPPPTNTKVTPKQARKQGTVEIQEEEKWVSTLPEPTGPPPTSGAQVIITTVDSSTNKPIAGAVVVRSEVKPNPYAEEGGDPNMVVTVDRKITNADGQAIFLVPIGTWAYINAQAEGYVPVASGFGVNEDPTRKTLPMKKKE